MELSVTKQREPKRKFINQATIECSHDLVSLFM
jgi:hypothetical protein